MQPANARLLLNYYDISVVSRKCQINVVAFLCLARNSDLAYQSMWSSMETLSLSLRSCIEMYFLAF